MTVASTRLDGVAATRLDRFSAMSVLVVDDNVANVELLRALLAAHGLFRVTAVTDSRMVAGLLASVDPDLVLLDLQMPHLNGHVVLEQVMSFAAGRYLPVLVTTADTSRRARDLALSRGARDFMAKPIDNVDLLLRVANLLETRQLYVNLRRSTAGFMGRRGQEPLADIETRIRHVLDTEAVSPVYQPVLDLGKRTVVGHEALARFAAPHRFGPAGWFADATAVGLGVELERMAVAKAVSLLAVTPPESFLAVNLSPAAILSVSEFPLCGAGACPRIVIELTEHEPIEDYSALHRALAPMREQGARLAADDLGSGYAGFRHLIALQPDIIKLDISLISGIQHSRGQRALTAALLAFAADVGAMVIAEGIETREELAVLQDLGVPWGQGYHLGRPVPVPWTGS